MSDRELDALVAEKVMGWHLPYPTDKVGEKLCNPPLGGWEAVPHYSTSGDGMLAVIEAMRGKGFDTHVHFWVLSTDEDEPDKTYYAIVDHEWQGDDGPKGDHAAASAPRAVAVASLLALGVEVPE